MADTITIPIEQYRRNPYAVKDVIRWDKHPMDIVRAPIIRATDALYYDPNDEFNFRSSRGQYITKGHDPDDIRTLSGPVRIDRYR